MKKLITNMVAALLFSVASVGWAGNGTERSGLAKPEQLSRFELVSDVRLTTVVTGPFGRKTRLNPVLVKGEYVSVFSDKAGTYYQGPKDCLPNPNPNALYPALDGGLWIPQADSGHTPKLWYYVKAMPENMRAGVLIRALDRLTVGNVRRDVGEIEDVGFLSSIQVSPYALPPVGSRPEHK